MSWATMHFATGMGCAGLAAGIGCVIFRRGWRWLPSIMTVGGFWAMVPDMPRIFRQDFPGLPYAALLGDKELELSLHRIGDLFFFHKQLDMQPKEYALLGMAIIILLYNISIVLLMWMEHRQRNSLIHRSYRSHKKVLKDIVHYGSEMAIGEDIEPAFNISTSQHPPPNAHPPSDDPVIGRIG